MSELFEIKQNTQCQKTFNIVIKKKPIHQGGFNPILMPKADCLKDFKMLYSGMSKKKCFNRQNIEALLNYGVIFALHDEQGQFIRLVKSIEDLS